MKFGGTSVEDEWAIERVSQIVHSRLPESPVIVVSAMAGVTDSLLSMAQAAAAGQIQAALRDLRALRRRHLAVVEASLREPRRGAADVPKLLDELQDILRGIAALGELTRRTTDHVLSFGELLSSRILAAALVARGIKAELVDSRDCLVTDAAHTCAVPLYPQTDERLRARLQPLLLAGKVPVMGGFIAATIDSIPTTLGRGGSDFSAAIVGAALDARHIEIWTDVEGMMTTDPRLCDRARRIDVLGFDEASEMAYFGARVLHPATLIPAVKKNIPVFVLNSRRPESRGTCIRARAPRSRTSFRAIAAKTGMQVINLRSPRRLGANGFLRAVFETLERHGCAADLVSTSEVSVSIALSLAQPVHGLVGDLKQLGDVEVEDAKAIICLVGKHIRGQVGIAASVFDTLAAANINVHMISQGASEINIGFVIEERDVPEAVRQLHQRFFEPKNRAKGLQVISRKLKRQRPGSLPLQAEVG
jgi:aspartate kinase